MILLKTESCSVGINSEVDEERRNASLVDAAPHFSV